METGMIWNPVINDELILTDWTSKLCRFWSWSCRCSIKERKLVLIENMTNTYLHFVRTVIWFFHAVSIQQEIKQIFVVYRRIRKTSWNVKKKTQKIIINTSYVQCLQSFFVIRSLDGEEHKVPTQSTLNYLFHACLELELKSYHGAWFDVFS